MITWKEAVVTVFNPLNAELNPICHFLALLGVHHFLHVSRIRVKSLTLRLLMSYIYRVSQEECARLRENVSYVKVHRYNPKHLYPKLNGYGDNGQRNVWSSCGSTYCTCSADALLVHCACPSLRVKCSQRYDCHVNCLEP